MTGHVTGGLKADTILISGGKWGEERRNEERVSDEQERRDCNGKGRVSVVPQDRLLAAGYEAGV
jgi:hypothetical protein